MHIEEIQLRDFIVSSGLVSRSDIADAVKKAQANGISLGTVLVNESKLSEDDLRRIHAYILGIPFVDLTSMPIDFDTLSMIPEPISRHYNIVAFKKNDGTLEVALLDLADLERINSFVSFLEQKNNLKILPRLTHDDSILFALRRYQKGLGRTLGDILGRDARRMTERKGANESVGNIVDTLLTHATSQNASSIHLEPSETDMIVRYRIHGHLYDAMTLPKDTGALIVGQIKILARLDLDESKIPQHGRFVMNVLEGSKLGQTSFRVSTMPTVSGEKMVLRVLQGHASGFTLEYLDFHGEGLERVHTAIHSRGGMTVVAGLQGSGKTTTLYTLVDMLNTPDVTISTIEEKIEYRIPRVNQTQVRADVGFNFSAGLRALVRQDADVIMVGKLNDAETISLACNAALSGTRVLAGVEAPSAVSALVQLAEMNPSAVSAIKTVIGLRMVRKLSAHKEAYLLTKAEISALKKRVDLDKVLAVLKEEKVVSAGDTWEKIPLYRPKKGTLAGEMFDGLVGLQEVLQVSENIKNLVMKKTGEKEIVTQALSEGMLSIIEDGMFKAVKGLTTMEEVLK